MRGWNATAGPSNQETPRGPRFGTIPKDSPKTARIRKPAFQQTAKEATAEKLPGFYNAFATSTPVRPSRNRNARDKVEMEEGIDGLWATNTKGKGKASTSFSLFGQPSQFASTGPPPPSPPSSPTRRVKSVIASASRTDIELPSDDLGAYAGYEAYDQADLGGGLEDVEMQDDNAGNITPEELDDIDSPNWREEVGFHIFVYLQLYLSLDGSTAPSSNPDAHCAIFNVGHYSDPYEGFIRVGHVPSIFTIVLKSMCSNPRSPRFEFVLR